RKRIKELNEKLPWNGFLWLDNREKMQVQLADLLKSRVSGSKTQGHLAAYWVNPDSLRSREYRIRAKEFDIHLKTFILEVHNMLTPEQKRYFVRKLEKVTSDIRALNRRN